MECLELDCANIEKRQKQPSSHPYNELSKTQALFPVSIIKNRTPILQNICERLLLKNNMTYRFNAKSGVTENPFNHLPKKR